MAQRYIPPHRRDGQSKTQQELRKDAITPTVLTGAKILCYGDSLTAGYSSFVPYATTLADELGQPCDHAGMCGWTTSQMLQRADSVLEGAFGLDYPGLRRLVESGEYKVVILMGGTNDLGTESPNKIMDNLSRLHQICHEAGAKTVALSVPQSLFASDRSPSSLGVSLGLRTKQKNINAMLQEYASANAKHCIYVDMESKVPWSKNNSDWTADGLHMSKSGYENFGRKLGPLVREFVSLAMEQT